MLKEKKWPYQNAVLQRETSFRRGARSERPARWGTGDETLRGTGDGREEPICISSLTKLGEQPSAPPADRRRGVTVMSSARRPRRGLPSATLSQLLPSPTSPGPRACWVIEGTSRGRHAFLPDKPARQAFPLQWNTTAILLTVRQKAARSYRNRTGHPATSARDTGEGDYPHVAAGAPPRLAHPRAYLLLGACATLRRDKW
ncbi:hypothetical protein SKAU_G00338170 [Synaphobranchus kaupii]|uniref:Uncharacterized protein n=1 Tax=Synaphobranchus kaupii TaxID=118154 RepID=A0A9Q1EMK4_SYNKA|nr:hypothetical protein SKAU_G00338170 [Synaphobranchus kaupii]